MTLEELREELEVKKRLLICRLATPDCMRHPALILTLTLTRRSSRLPTTRPPRPWLSCSRDSKSRYRCFGFAAAALAATALAATSLAATAVAATALVAPALVATAHATITFAAHGRRPAGTRPPLISPSARR